MIKYVFLSDWHIPDHNRALIKPIFSFIKDYKPDVVYILGDFLNCTSVSHFLPDPYYHVDLVDELKEGAKILDELSTVVRKANSRARIIYKAGNHEARIQKYLAQSPQLAELTINDEYVISLPHLLELKKRGIEWEEYLESRGQHGILFEHGDKVRAHAGYTAKAMFESRGQSGLSGHTHRGAYYSVKRGNTVNFWIETFCLCNLQPNPRYALQPNWSNGFVIGQYSKETKQFYPTLIPIFNDSFVWGDKLYS